jgi:hypothetical protein
VKLHCSKILLQPSAKLLPHFWPFLTLPMTMAAVESWRRNTLALHSFQISQATNMDGWFISPRLYCRSISWMPHHEGISFQIRVVNLHLYKRWPSIIFLFGWPNSILHNQTSKELVFFGSFSKDQSVAILVKINTCLTAFDIPTC